MLSGPGRSPAAPGNRAPHTGRRFCGSEAVWRAGRCGLVEPGEGRGISVLLGDSSCRGCPESRSPAGRLPGIVCPWVEPGTQAFGSGSACLPPGPSSLRSPRDTSTPLVRSCSATGWWPLVWGFVWLCWSKRNGAWGPSAAHRAHHGRCPKGPVCSPSPARGENVSSPHPLVLPVCARGVGEGPLPGAPRPTQSGILGLMSCKMRRLQLTRTDGAHARLPRPLPASPPSTPPHPSPDAPRCFLQGASRSELHTLSGGAGGRKPRTPLCLPAVGLRRWSGAERVRAPAHGCEWPRSGASGPGCRERRPWGGGAVVAAVAVGRPALTAAITPVSHRG